MQLKYDETINVAIGLNLTSKSWKNTQMLWSEFVQRLSEPVVTSETYAEFIKATKQEQTRIKDVGGFIGGVLVNSKRNKTSVLSRQLVTLDIDFSHSNFWWDFTILYECAAVLHSTHKSTPEKPRHRLIIPLDREVTQEEYQAIARKIASRLNMELFDKSTFDTNRLMFWPSVSKDVQYYFKYQDGEFLNADSVLNTYTDWHDVGEWPTTSEQNDHVSSILSKQENPEEKSGIIGTFCRTYTIEQAIETFLQDEYEPAGEGRYTYKKGTTAAGVVVYNHKFSFSHHGTDPACDRLCNAFDLVRIHKFGHLDSGKEKRDSDKRSFKLMEEFAAKDPATRRHIAEEKFAEAKFDFQDNVKIDEQPDNKWIEQLEANTKGEYISSANNINLIIQNDYLLRDAFKLNVFDNKRYVTRSLPWRKVPTQEPFKDVDYSGIRNYIECIYGISSAQKIDDALALEFERKHYHPIIDYIKSLSWDSTNRIDTLLIDYFGAEDNAYTRAAMRKMLCAAIARVFNPGVKFDLVLVLVGAQETYKSTFIKKLGKDWFSDTFTTIQGKESFEQLQGAWIIEIAELSGFKKAEIENIKHFITKREDMFRPAYGRVVETYKRQCVFFGTTNNADFLHDPTGNRRFMPIDVRESYVTKSVMDDLNDYEIDQIWAEAYELYKNNEPLYLKSNEDVIAKIEQHRHIEIDERLGLIEQFIETKLPSNWEELGIYERRAWLEDPLSNEGTVTRYKICVAEIWCECLCKDRTDMTRYNTRAINDLLKSLKGWEFVSSTSNFKNYGKQKYFRRKDELL